MNVLFFNISSSAIKKITSPLAILKRLYNHGFRNLLIEGGGELTNSLIKNKIFNKFYLYKSSKILSKSFEYLEFSSQNILNQKYKKKINLNLNLRKDRITLYS